MNSIVKPTPQDTEEHHHYQHHHHHHHHHCCCCCYCCCYCCCQKNSQKSIAPWSTVNNDSAAQDSCCSCSSSISIERDQDNNRTNTPSTACTTPIDPKILREENSTPDLDKLLEKKIHAIEELLQTERDYVQDLSHLVLVCLKVLSHQQWISQQHKPIIIRNSKEILDFHKQFISHHTTTSSMIENNWSVIAKAFLEQIEQFSLYKHYCDMHAEAWTLTSEYRDRPEWAGFVKECAALADSDLYHVSPQQKKLHFEDYLIKPVQRVCRYQLLIKEIIRYTPPQTPEYELWNIALSEMQDIVADIDDRKLQRDLKERTDRFISRLEDDWRISKRHVSQLGNLLIAGAVEITYSALGQSVSKPRYLGCFVFQTYIIMARPKKATSYEPKYWFPLRMTDFEDLADIEGQREHSFVVRCKKHTFAFSASCSQEKLLWVKKLQEAIVTAKIEASDENLSAQDFIVSSLPGITSKRSPQSIRLSRSFTNILDMTLSAASSTNNNGDSSTVENLANDTSSSRMTPADRKILRRSASTSIQFYDIMKMNTMHKSPSSTTATATSTVTSPLGVSLTKRYSADYSSFVNRRSQSQQNLGLKPRNNSDMYIRSDSFSGPSAHSNLPRRRPSSLDLLSAANNNMIGKMSFQFKNNHQNTLRMTVDHKLRDVCTQEYLSSRAWRVRDRDQPISYNSTDSLLNSSSLVTPMSLNNNSILNSNTITGNNSSSSNIYSNIVTGNSNSEIAFQSPVESIVKKHKSTSFIKSSASNLSMMIPKRSNDSKLPVRQLSEYDMSNASSSSSIVDRSQSPNSIYRKNSSSKVLVNGSATRRPSFSSNIFRRISQGQRYYSETPVSNHDNESFFSIDNTGRESRSHSSASNNKGRETQKERRPNRKQIFVGKVLRRIASLHHKPATPSPSPFDFYTSHSFVDTNEQIKKASSVDSKTSRSTRWKKHEELMQLQVRDQPTISPSSMVILQEVEINQKDNNKQINSSDPIIGSKIISAFAYASTPPQPPTATTTIKKKASNNGSLNWKNRLSFIRSPSFLKNHH